MTDKRFDGLCPCHCGCYISVTDGQICYACKSDALSDSRAVGRSVRAAATASGRTISDADVRAAIARAEKFHYLDRANADQFRAKDRPRS